MKPTIIAAIREIAGGKLTEDEMGRIADRTIAIVEEKQKLVAVRTIEAMQNIAKDVKNDGH